LLVLAVIAIAAAVVALVAAPLVRGDDTEANRRTEQLAELEARKEAKYREIRDAQNDLRAGKLSAEDHRALDAGLRREAVEILAEIDRVSGVPEEGTPPPG
jgi:hypothetical protein